MNSYIRSSNAYPFEQNRENKKVLVLFAGYGNKGKMVGQVRSEDVRGMGLYTCNSIWLRSKKKTTHKVDTL